MQDNQNEITEEMELFMLHQIESERLFLVPMSQKELEESLKEEQSILPESVMTEIICRAFESRIARLKELPEEVHVWYTYWRMIRKEDKKAIGIAGCKGLPNEDGMVEIGYAMGTLYRRHGYMTEGLMALLDWVYECPFCRGAKLRIHPSNVPSVHTAQSCGFEKTDHEDVFDIYEYLF